MTEALKGGVSYNDYKYIWRTEGNNICQICRSMEGSEYESEEDIPNRPHPNCKCYVDIVKNNEHNEQNKDNENDDKEDEIINIIDELIGDMKSLQDEVSSFDTYIQIEKQDYQISISASSFIHNYSSEINKLNDYLEYNISELESLKSKPKKEALTEISRYQNYLDICQTHLQNLIECFRKEIERIKNKEELENDFQKNYKKHSELKDLNYYTYYKDKKDLLHGYELVREVRGKESGFDGYVFKKGKEAVVVYQGSNNPKDYQQDAFDIHSGQNPQLKDAQKLYEETKRNPDYDSIIISGYSLGGNTGNQIGTINNEYTVIFNPYYGIDGQLQNEANNSGKIIETHPEKVVIYRTEGDEFGNANKEGHVADTIYKLPHKDYTLPSKINPFKNHMLQNIKNPSKETILPEVIENRNQQIIIFPTLEKQLENIYKQNNNKYYYHLF